jgi:hypothetical protein
MNQHSKLLIAACCVFTFSGCSHSDTKKLTDDAKATGEAAKQTTLDALGAARRTTDNIVSDTKQAADSDTAKELATKTKNAAKKAVDKTKEVAQDAKDAVTTKPSSPQQ